MKKRVTLGAVGILIALAGGAAAIGSLSDRDPSGSATQWAIRLTLDAPNLHPQAVQWAILRHDPTTGFKASLSSPKVDGVYRDQMLLREDTEEAADVRNSAIAVCWNREFKNTTGDELYLLTGGDDADHSVTSTRPAGVVWITSKAVFIDGEPVCWSLPVRVSYGETAEVTLTEDNAYDVRSVFDGTLGSSKP